MIAKGLTAASLECDLSDKMLVTVGLPLSLASSFFLFLSKYLLSTFHV